jgi:RND family efflux transporter MFP subunit
MKKNFILILTALTALAWACSGSGDPRPDPASQVPAKVQTDKSAPEVAPAQKTRPDAAGRPGMKMPGGGEQAVAVNVMRVPRKSLRSYLVLNGIVEPSRKIQVFSRLPAYVRQLVREEGDYVRENEVLAVLDDIEVRISYEQARIALDQAQVSLDEAEKNYERSRTLVERNLISEQEFQTQEALFKQRQFELRTRRENYKNLELQLGWTRLRAPSEGFITERLVEVGGRVNANQQVFTIEDFKPLLVRVFVPTTDAVQLKTGLPAGVSAGEVLPGTAFTGEVKLINPRIDTQTGTVKVTVEVFDETLRLKPGMFVEVRISIGDKADVLAIPRRALLFRQNKIYAFVVDGNRAVQREIQIGLMEEDEVEVTDGLVEGDVIVTVGVDGLKDGQAIEVIR